MTHEHDTQTMEEKHCDCQHGGECGCGENCQCATGCNCGSCGQEACGENCSCAGGDCGCEQEADGASYLLHKAKMKVLLEKLATHIEKEHGAEYEKLAKLLLEVAREHEKSKEELQAKRDALNEQFGKLFN